MKCVVGNSVAAIDHAMEQLGKEYQDFDIFCLCHPKRLPAAIESYGEDTIIATMNPYVVDCFDASEVLVVCEDKSAMLSEHPEYAKFAGDMTTGEFWAWAGEKWVKEI